MDSVDTDFKLQETKNISHLTSIHSVDTEKEEVTNVTVGKLLVCKLFP